MSDPIIKVENVHKDFKLPLDRYNSIKSRIIHFGSRGYEIQNVLKGVSFEIQKGEFFGIVGRNGSGKSTLLKLLAGIYTPTSGSITVNGKLTPFIELGVGFNPELSGKDNVYLNGALLGFTRKEIDEMYESIVEFAELEKFMDQKLKNYSSGMQVRLAFSIAIKAKSDILLLDEVLAVGDSAFQQKCFDYFYELKQKKQTVVFISHDMEAVKKFCDRAILIDGGLIKASGNPQEITDEYLVDNFYAGAKSEEATQKRNAVKSLITDMKNPRLISPSQTIELKLGYEIKTEKDVEIRLALTKDGVSFAHVNTRDKQLPMKPGKYTIGVNLDAKNLLEGQHDIYWGVFEKDSGAELAFKNKAASFFVQRVEPTKYGLVYIDSNWILPSNKSKD